jgi:hypothetical protein
MDGGLAPLARGIVCPLPRQRLRAQLREFLSAGVGESLSPTPATLAVCGALVS